MHVGLSVRAFAYALLLTPIMMIDAIESIERTVSAHLVRRYSFLGGLHLRRTVVVIFVVVIGFVFVFVVGIIVNAVVVIIVVVVDSASSSAMAIISEFDLSCQ